MPRLLTKKETAFIKEIEEKIESLKKVQEKYKEKVLKKMQNSGLKKIEIDEIEFTVRDSFDRTDLNKKKLEVDFPELVKKYSKTVHVKETLLINR